MFEVGQQETELVAQYNELVGQQRDSLLPRIYYEGALDQPQLLTCLWTAQTELLDARCLGLQPTLANRSVALHGRRLPNVAVKAGAIEDIADEDLGASVETFRTLRYTHRIASDVSKVLGRVPFADAAEDPIKRQRPRAYKNSYWRHMCEEVHAGTADAISLRLILDAANKRYVSRSLAPQTGSIQDLLEDNTGTDELASSVHLHRTVRHLMHRDARDAVMGYSRAKTENWHSRQFSLIVAEAGLRAKFGNVPFEAPNSFRINDARDARLRMVYEKAKVVDRALPSEVLEVLASCGNSPSFWRRLGKASFAAAQGKDV